jgi:hypothetical protein
MKHASAGYRVLMDIPIFTRSSADIIDGTCAWIEPFTYVTPPFQ